MKDIKVGFVGLGSRGYGLLTHHVAVEHGAAVTAVCDLYEDRAQKGADAVFENLGTRPAVYLDHNDLIKDENVNTVIIASAWESHVEIAVKALRAGKAVALEVGGAYTVEQCHELVAAYEETHAPFMFLENCCFGRREMMVLNMAEQGLLGEIVHCTGGYMHDLRSEITGGIENRHYRLRNYLHRNCENYPTHELGPIAKILHLNHGNRMVTLSSTASKSAGLHQYIMDKMSDNEFLKNAKFAQGDVVTTVIKCAGGETIVLTLDTTLPRYYSRNFTIRGTKGFYEETTDSVFLDTEENEKHHMDWGKFAYGNAEQFQEEYDHPVWKKYLSDGVHGGHGGMDGLEFQIFFDCLRNDKPMPIDVYDAASWMCVTALSELSIQRGGAVVDFPDFTKGKWILNIID